MSDSLLPYYNRELNAIRTLAAEFADANPKIAGRLRLSADAVDDPHVARLLEGVAFLCARVQHRLDDDFPELTDALLTTLYPHYLAPVPSCAIAQFTAAADAQGPVLVPAGRMLDTEPVRGEACRYRTTAAATVWPVEIEAARLSGLPLAAPPNPQAVGRDGARAVAVLRLTLRCSAPGMTLTALGLDRLRLFLRAAPNVSLPLYELLCAHVLSVALADGPNDPAPVILPAASIAPGGFTPEEALLPWPARSFTGFRLLTEYFAFAEKFLFLDLSRLDAKTLLGAGPRMDVFIYLGRSAAELERTVDADTVALGCTPIVNLFPQRCDPVPLDHLATEYRVEPDRRRPGALEVWTVERVREGRSDGTHRPWAPFYRATAGLRPGGEEQPGGFYTVLRRASTTLPGSDVLLGPYQPDFDAEQSGASVLSVDALCTNRHLPADLPFGGGHPRLTLTEGMAAIGGVACLTAPTPPLRAPLREAGFWRLVSHLSLGHLSVVGGEDGAAALRDVLRLYDLRQTAETAAAIEGLVGVTSRPGTARVPGSRAGAFCRGLDVTLEFDARAWQGGGLFLLASVLDAFLALHATVNAFVRTSVVLRGRPGRAAFWPARAGARPLL